MDLLPKIQIDLLQEEPEEIADLEESDDEEEEVKVEEPPLPEIKEKTIIPEEDIFMEKKVKKDIQIKEVTPDKPIKKKRVMSEAQLERLRLGREKALLTRQAKAKERKEVKDLTEKKKKKDIQKLREEVSDTPKPEPVQKKAISSLDDIPIDLLVTLQEKAIEGYDTKRKARKVKKKEEEAKTKQNNFHLHMVQNAIQPTQPSYGEVGFWNDCF
tara:strand:+ start:2837 stop:3478 length:642 start_codon:yes stop_codon:yes gene_type:complete